MASGRVTPAPAVASGRVTPQPRCAVRQQIGGYSESGSDDDSDDDDSDDDDDVSEHVQALLSTDSSGLTGGSCSSGPASSAERTCRRASKRQSVEKQPEIFEEDQLDAAERRTMAEALRAQLDRRRSYIAQVKDHMAGRGMAMARIRGDGELRRFSRSRLIRWLEDPAFVHDVDIATELNDVLESWASEAGQRRHWEAVKQWWARVEAERPVLHEVAVMMGRKPMPGTRESRTYLTSGTVLAAIAAGPHAAAARACGLTPDEGGRTRMDDWLQALSPNSEADADRVLAAWAASRPSWPEQQRQEEAAQAAAAAVQEAHEAAIDRVLVMMGRKPMPGTSESRTYLMPGPVLAAIAAGPHAAAARACGLTPDRDGGNLLGLILAGHQGKHWEAAVSVLAAWAASRPSWPEQQRQEEEAQAAAAAVQEAHEAAIDRVLVMMGRKPMPGTSESHAKVKPGTVLAAIAAGPHAAAARACGLTPDEGGRTRMDRLLKATSDSRHITYAEDAKILMWWAGQQ